MKQKVLTKIDKLLEIVEVLQRTHDPRRIAVFLSNKHPQDVAKVLERLPSDLRVQVFRYLPNELQAEVLIYLEEQPLEEILETLSDQDLYQLVEEMDADDAADFLGELDQEEREKILSLVDEEDRQELQELLTYPENTAGGLMSKEFLALPEDTTVREALKRVKEWEEDISLIFVTDQKGRFKGVVPLRDLIDAPDDRRIGVLVKEIPTVPATMDQEEVVRVFEKYDLFYLPVVDEADRLLGVITVDDILDVLEEEASEDIARLSGLSRIESLLLPPWNSARARIPWLLANLGTAFLASAVVSLFKNAIDAFAYLAVFMPVIAGMGGNAGIQALALTVRSLALGEISRRDATRIILNEFLTGLMVGLVVGTASGLIAWLWVGKPLFGLLVFAALLANMVVACIAGFLVPLAIKALGGDPATASGVIVTTFTDVTGYFFFLGLSTLFLKTLTG